MYLRIAITFLTTGDARDFQGIGRRLLGGFVTDATTVVLDPGNDTLNRR